MTHLSWNTTQFFFDIDDTLIDTSEISARAATGIYNALLETHIPEQAQTITDAVNAYYALLLAGHRLHDQHEAGQNGEIEKSYNALLEKITELQPAVKKEYGVIKKWSRELYVALAGREHNIAITPDTATKGANGYWEEISRMTSVYADALACLQEIRNHKRPIHLATSSDSRLHMQSDGTFTYSPSYSEGFKRARIERTRKQGITYDSLSIGDPEDKPNRIFFQKSINAAERAIGSTIDLSKAVMIGDSFDGDLKTPQEIGFGAIVLIDRAASTTEWLENNYLRTHDLRAGLNELLS